MKVHFNEQTQLLEVKLEAILYRNADLQQREEFEVKDYFVC